MRYLSSLFICFFLLLSLSSEAEVINMRFANPHYASNNTFEVTVQLKAQDLNFEIGSATVFFNYNAEALAAPAYESINFNDKNKCVANGSSAPYSNNFNFLETKGKGEANYAIHLHSANYGCPSVGSEWVDVAKFVFKVKNAALPVDLSFNKNSTAFNTVENNGKLHTIGDAAEFTAVVTSVNDDLAANGINIYPNHTQDLINIAWESDKHQAINITVYDMAGRKVIQNQEKGNAGKNIKSINLSGLGNGYFLVEVEKDGKKASEKVLLTK